MAKSLVASTQSTIGPAVKPDGSYHHCPYCNNNWFMMDTYRQSIYDPTILRITRIICGLCGREQS